MSKSPIPVLLLVLSALSSLQICSAFSAETLMQFLPQLLPQLFQMFNRPPQTNFVQYPPPQYMPPPPQYIPQPPPSSQQLSPSDESPQQAPQYQPSPPPQYIPPPQFPPPQMFGSQQSNPMSMFRMIRFMDEFMKKK